MMLQRQAPGRMRLLLSLTVNLMVAALVLLLVRSSKFLTHEQLAQVRVGMSLQDAIRLLGSPKPPDSYSAGFERVWTRHPDGRGNYFPGYPTSAEIRFVPKNALSATIVAPIDGKIMNGFDPQGNPMSDLPYKKPEALWIGRTHVLWVIAENNGVIVNLWLLPYREEGGGVIAWAKQQYETWFPTPVATAPALPMPAPAPNKPGS